MVAVGVAVGVVVALALAVVVVVGVVVALALAVVVVVGVALAVGVAVLKKEEIMGKPVSPLSVGKAVIVRLVTHYYTGRVVKLSASEIVLSEAAWIADTGRWADALSKGTLSEIEPFPDLVTLNRGALVDATEWKHPLPRQQK